MRIYVNDSYNKLGQDDYVRARNIDYIERCISENIQIDSDEFEISVHNSDGSYRDIEIGSIEDSLYIMLNSSHISADRDERLFDDVFYGTNRYGKLLKPTGTGSIFYDEEGTAVAEYRDTSNNGSPIFMLNILFDITHSDGAWIEFTRIIKRFNERIIKPLNLSRGMMWKDGEDKSDLLKSIVDTIEEQKTREILGIRSYIESYEGDIETSKRRIVELTGKLRNSFIKLKALEDSQGDGHEKISNDLDLIVKLDRVKELAIKDDKIIVYTNVLYIHDQNGKKYYGGEYEIEIKLNSSDVTFKNRTEGRKSFWTKNDPHPHISGNNGRACWGSLSSTIAELCSQNELYAVTLSAIDFLENVDIHEWAGGHVVNWDSVDEDGNRIPPDPDVLDPTQREQEEDDEEERFYCEGCDEYYHYNEANHAYDVVEVVNDGEDFNYGDTVDLCHDCLESDAVYLSDADVYAIEISNVYEESDDWVACLHCGEIHHLDKMVEVLDNIEVNDGEDFNYGDLVGYVCGDSCSDYYEYFYAEEENRVYYAQQVDYKETEEDYNERIQG